MIERERVSDTKRERTREKNLKKRKNEKERE